MDQSITVPHQSRRASDLVEAAAFASLPDEALVPLPTVRGLTCVSDVTIWRMCRDGRLPKPLKLTDRAVRWRVGDLRKALAAFVR